MSSKILHFAIANVSKRERERENKMNVEISMNLWRQLRKLIRLGMHPS